MTGLLTETEGVAVDTIVFDMMRCDVFAHSVKAGDKVIGIDGAIHLEPDTIISVNLAKQRPVIRITVKTFSDTFTLVCSAENLIFTTHGWVLGRDLTPQHIVALADWRNHSLKYEWIAKAESLPPQDVLRIITEGRNFIANQFMSKG